ncbi:MAG: septum formation protein Maf [Bacteroidales bacterium]|jgi:septum formation protein|nr:septum formation protein Maf [Bacteroidales bacterium]
MLLDNLNNHKIYLASKSPRRRELLAGMGIDFDILTTDVEETYDPAWSPEEIVMHLSRLKLSPIDMAQYDPKTIFITCDTIVVVDGQIIGKPKDKADAERMLKMLSGNTHTVYSGLTVATPQKQLTNYRATDVVFETLSDDMIQYYIDTYQPFDKAGSYGVQEWIGRVGIREVRGSFYNVMGLPTRLLWTMLEQVC